MVNHDPFLKIKVTSIGIRMYECPSPSYDEAAAAATKMQAAARGHRSRTEFREKKDAVIKIQSAHRGRAVRKEMKAQHEAGLQGGGAGASLKFSILLPNERTRKTWAISIQAIPRCLNLPMPKHILNQPLLEPFFSLSTYQSKPQSDSQPLDDN
jgi:hypothetical protein